MVSFAIFISLTDETTENKAYCIVLHCIVFCCIVLYPSVYMVIGSMLWLLICWIINIQNIDLPRRGSDEGLWCFLWIFVCVFNPHKTGWLSYLLENIGRHCPVKLRCQWNFNLLRWNTCEDFVYKSIMICNKDHCFPRTRSSPVNVIYSLVRDKNRWHATGGWIQGYAMSQWLTTTPVFAMTRHYNHDDMQSKICEARQKATATTGMNGVFMFMSGRWIIEAR